MDKVNGMSHLRAMVVSFMENDAYCTHLRNKGWYGIEDAICNFVCQLLEIKEDDKIFSGCDRSESFEASPTLFEEKIYRRVSKHYHIQDILSAIDDVQCYREEEGLPKLIFKVCDIMKMTSNFENNITGEDNIQLAKDTVSDYLETNVIDVEE